MNDNTLKKMKWACRRGMLELDVILNQFLEEAYPTLALSDQHRFAQLLSCSDPELFVWLLGYEDPSDPDLLKITQLIRQHVRSRF